MIPYVRPQQSTLFSRAQQPSGISFSERFDNEKIRKIRPLLSKLPKIFEAEAGTAPSLPRRIYTMTNAELRRSSRRRCYEAGTDTIKISPDMNAGNILSSVVSEMIHADLPWLVEAEADALTDRILKKLRPTVRKGKGRKEPTPLGIDATRLTHGLWIGSKPEIGRAVAESGFDLLVLCAEEYQPPAWQFPGVDVIHAPFDDNDIGPLPHEKKIAKAASQQVVDALRNGSNVLVTCYAGRNRSGLVCGLALAANGHDPVRIIHLIKSRRKHALTNQWFVDLVAAAG